MIQKTWKPVAEGLFELCEEGVRLLAGRRASDGSLCFPVPAAERKFCEIVKLPVSGNLWAWTVQRFRPKPPYDGDDGPEGFQPFAVGYVAFASTLIVEGRLQVDDFSTLQLGLAMRCVIDLYRTDADGTAVATYAFRPALTP